MPSRNILRSDADESFYHVYARGINKSVIFIAPEDKDYFLYLISRHLSIKQVKAKNGYAYPHYRGKIELLSYCLMDNHLHLLFYQKEKGALSSLMQSILTAYTMYHNRKYKRRGPLLESRYKSALIDNDVYLLHVSRYIHLNPRSWKYYRHSSIIHIRKASEPEWLQSNKVLTQHVDRKAYLEFVSDYEEMRDMLAELKYQLADQ